MSIFGEGVCRGPNIDEVNEILSGYAKTDYVDVQDGLHVLKAGDTMSGDLDMRGRLVRGLPKDLRSHKGDEATSWNQVVKTTSSAFEAAVDRRKPLITIWAEQKWTMVDDRYEWSFGSGAARGLADGGYPCWPQVGSFVWVCLQQQLPTDPPPPVSILWSTGWKTRHMV